MRKGLQLCTHLNDDNLNGDVVRQSYGRSELLGKRHQ